MSSRCIYRQQNDKGHIEVWEEENKRSLWFDDVILQSEIYLNDPAVLPNPVNRAMLAHLMFGQQPDQVLLGGCGGGAIARWLHARNPEIHGTAIELSADVALIAHEYFDFPPPQSKWQLHTGDIRQHLKHTDQRYDFILMDLEEEQWSPAWLSSGEFLRDCRQTLTEQGVLTVNLICKNAEHFAVALWEIRQAFEQQTICLPIKGHDNILVMAFAAAPDLSQLDHNIQRANQQWGLEFGRFKRNMKQHNPRGSGIF